MTDTATVAPVSGNPPAPTPAPAPAPAAWYDGVKGVDQELTGYFTNRGLDKLSPAEAAVQAAIMHRNAEKLIGGPADQVVRLPKAGDPNSEREFYTKLGVPTVATDYDFSDIKFSDGEVLDKEFTDWLAGRALELHLPKDAAVRLASEMVKKMDSDETSQATLKQSEVIAQKQELAKNWGPNFDTNKFLAQKGVQALGLDPETIAGLESVVGYAKIMEAMRKVGELNGEAKYFANGGSVNPNGVLTADGAKARQRELMADKDWAARYTSGGKKELEEMMALSRILSAGQPAYDPTRGY